MKDNWGKFQIESAIVPTPLLSTPDQTAKLGSISMAQYMLILNWKNNGGALKPAKISIVVERQHWLNSVRI